MKKTENYKFFQHRKCEYFPCHSDLPIESMNCLFCFCPWYGNCGTQNSGIDCKDCNLPHDKNFYNTIIRGIEEIRKQKKLEPKTK